MIEIDLLYFDGCPSWHTAWTELGQALVSLRLDATVNLRNVDQLADGERHGFAGSPTIRINGHDLEGYDGPPTMACRRYLDNGGRGWPSQALLHTRLREAASSPGTIS